MDQRLPAICLTRFPRKHKSRKLINKKALIKINQRFYITSLINLKFNPVANNFNISISTGNKGDDTA